MKLIITSRENSILKKYPKEARGPALLDLRFDMWLRYNNLKPDALSKARMKQAYRAGAAMAMQRPSLLNRLTGLIFKVNIK